MNSNRSDGRLFASYSSESQSNNNNNQPKDDDNISIASLNAGLTNGLHYLASNINTFLNSRQTSNKHGMNTPVIRRDSQGNGLIVNGFLFDDNLFQPARSSYVIDYSDTPQDLNRFLEGHHSSSRTCQLDAHLYKLAFIITLSDWYVDKELLLGYYPRDENIFEEILHYKRFCFPELNPLQRNGGQSFNDQTTYVFTRILSNGHVEYGYCRRITKEYNQITRFPIVICIVSTHSYFKLYDAILNELITMYTSNELECNSLMQSFYSKPIPISTLNSSGITCILQNRRLFFYVCPRDARLNHDYYSTLLSCLSPSQIIHLFESMLRSKRLLIFSSYPSKLTKCCLALSLLIYPFIWPYSFVSLMPTSWLHDLLDSPCPYIYGCLYETIHQIPLILDNDTIRIDLDSSTIEGSNDTSYLLPLNLRQTLEGSLEYLKKFRLNKLNSTLINLGVSEACLHVFIELFYRLPEFFKRETLPNQINIQYSICSDYFNRRDSGIDLQSVVSIDVPQMIANHERKREENSLGYEFREKEFLRVQPSSSYVLFLKEFIAGMIFMKFLDDYQRNDEDKNEYFSLFSQRLNERHQRTAEELTIHPLIRFRQTIDVLDHQIKQASKQTNPSLSKFLKKIFE